MSSWEDMGKPSEIVHDFQICTDRGAFGGLFGSRKRCRFRPRYDESGPALELLNELASTLFESNLTPELAAQLQSTQTYVGDICVSCGKFVERRAK